MKHPLRSSALAVAFGLQCVAAAPALAAPASDALAQCLIRSATSSDKAVLVQWVFATEGLHPDLKWMVTISDKQRAELNRKTAILFEDLLTRSCPSEARRAFQEEALDASLSALAVDASSGLFANLSVRGGQLEMLRYFDAARVHKALGLSH